MKFYKEIQSGYIVALLTDGVCNENEITEAEYNAILDIIRSKPATPEGYGYRLKTDLTWELYELPIIPPEDEEATIEDYESALAELGVR